jgi:hypothetical protein
VTGAGVIVEVWFVADGGSVFERFEAATVSTSNMRDRPTLYFRGGRVVESPLGTGPASSVSYADAPRILVRPAGDEEGGR